MDLKLTVNTCRLILSKVMHLTIVKQIAQQIAEANCPFPMIGIQPIYNGSQVLIQYSKHI